MKANTRFPVAIHILAYTAMKGPGVTSEELVQSINTNPVVVRRLNARLKKAGLLTVSNGPNGGASLSRPPEEISLLDVYQAARADEDVLIFETPQHPNAECPIGGHILGGNGQAVSGNTGRNEGSSLAPLDRGHCRPYPGKSVIFYTVCNHASYKNGGIQKFMTSGVNDFYLKEPVGRLILKFAVPSITALLAFSLSHRRSDLHRKWRRVSGKCRDQCGLSDHDHRAGHRAPDRRRLRGLPAHLPGA